MQKKRTGKERRITDNIKKAVKKEKISTKDNENRTNEIKGIACIAVGTIFVCGIFGLNVGFVGVYFATFLQYLFGMGSIVPAVFLIYFGYYYIMKGKRLPISRHSIGATVAFICILAIMHHITVPVGSEIMPSSLPNGGGFLGGIVLFIIRKFFGELGGIVLLGAGVVGSIVMASSWSLASGIDTTQKTAQKTAEIGAEVAKETAIVAYSKAKQVESKVQEQVVAQMQNIQEGLSDLHDKWEERQKEKKIEKKRQQSFFNQETLEEDSFEVKAPLYNSDAYSDSMGYGVGRNYSDSSTNSRYMENDSQVEYCGTVGFEPEEIPKTQELGIEDEDLAVDNIWGLKGNPGEVISKMQAEEIEGEESKESFELNIDTGEISLIREDLADTADDELVDPYSENQEEAFEFASPSKIAEEQINNSIGNDEIYENDEEETKEAEEEYEEHIEEQQAIGTSSKGKAWFDDINDNDIYIDDDDLLTVGSIGNTIPAKPQNAQVKGNNLRAISEATINATIATNASVVANAVASESMLNGVATTSSGEDEEQKSYEEIPYIMPRVDELLDIQEKADMAEVREEISEKAQILSQTLKDFNVKASIIGASRGPAVTQYEIKPAPGVKVNKITNLSEEIALNMAVAAVRIDLIAGKAAMGIEVPNTIRDSVPLREVLEHKEFDEAKSKLTVGLGMDIGGNPIFADLAKMPHLLVAGATGSGKSVCINTLISSVLFKAKPDEVKFILVDPKMVELSMYNDIPHLMVPVVTDAKKAASVLNWSVQEMERRYSMLSVAGVRNMASYNKLYKDEPEKKMCSIVIIIDELADLMMVAPHDVEDAICRIAQKARAAGIYLVLATQRPSVNVITGTIKANIPSRISFAVTSQIDSRTILDTAGAEKLLGRGDMLFSPSGSLKPTRVQGAFISDEEVERLLDFIRSQGHKIEANKEIIEFTEREAAEEQVDNDSGDKNSNAKKKKRNKSDALMGESLDLILSTGQASASNVQRRFRIGFGTAQRIIDNMEELGILGPAQGSKPREILVTAEEAKAILEEWDNS